MDSSVIIEEMGVDGKSFQFDDSSCKELNSTNDSYTVQMLPEADEEKFCDSNAMSTNEQHKSLITIASDEPPVLESQESRQLQETPQQTLEPRDYGQYEEQIENLFCVYCHKFFETPPRLLCHTPCFFLRRGVARLEAGMEPYCGHEPYQFRCEFEKCDKHEYTLEGLQIHYTNHFEPRFSCKECPEKFLWKQSILSHITYKHPTALTMKPKKRKKRLSMD